MAAAVVTAPAMAVVLEEVALVEEGTVVAARAPEDQGSGVEVAMVVVEKVVGEMVTEERAVAVRVADMVAAVKEAAAAAVKEVAKAVGVTAMVVAEETALGVMGVATGVLEKAVATAVAKEGEVRVEEMEGVWAV